MTTSKIWILNGTLAKKLLYQKIQRHFLQMFVEKSSPTIQRGEQDNGLTNNDFLGDDDAPTMATLYEHVQKQGETPTQTHIHALLAMSRLRG